MQRSETRFLTTHAGSLPRSEQLVELQVREFKGAEVDQRALSEAVLASTRDVVRRQINCGIDIGNNGEQSRESFFTYVQHRMSGFAGTSDRPVMRDIVKYPSWMKLRMPQFANSVSLLAATQAQAAVAYVDEAPLQEELALFEEVLDSQTTGFSETFVTAPSPGIIAAAMENTFYPDLDSYIDALGRALATEYQAIVARGHVLQLDCPDLAMERHTYFADESDEVFLQFVSKVISAIDRALGEIDPAAVRMHVCWGNYNCSHELDVPLETILPSLAQARVGALMLSMANPRHAHEFRLMTPQNIPDDMLVIAGVIDTTTNYVEHPQVVADRIEAVANQLGDPHRVIAGTDCGFDTSAGLRDVAEEIVWAKLEALAEGAAIATSRCF